MPPPFKKLCGVRVAHHHFTGAPSISRRAGRGPALKRWEIEPAIPLWYRFASHGKGMSEHCLKSQEREQGASTKGAHNVMHTLTWDLIPDCTAVLELPLHPGYQQTGALLVPHWCCPTAPSFCSSSVHNRWKLFALCSQERIRQVLRSDIWRCFSPVYPLLRPTLRTKHTFSMGFVRYHQCSVMLRSLYKSIL